MSFSFSFSFGLKCGGDAFACPTQLPHLLFYGPPGTGKTTTINAIARQIYGSAAAPCVVRHARALRLLTTPTTHARAAKSRLVQRAHARAQRLGRTRHFDCARESQELCAAFRVGQASWVRACVCRERRERASIDVLARKIDARSLTAPSTRARRTS